MLVHSHGNLVVVPRILLRAKSTFPGADLVISSRLTELAVKTLPYEAIQKCRVDGVFKVLVRGRKTTSLKLG